jgi:hypothetical protein
MMRLSIFLGFSTRLSDMIEAAGGLYSFACHVNVLAAGRGHAKQDWYVGTCTRGERMKTN